MNTTMTIQSKKVGNKITGDGNPCFIIAEIGTDHNGDIGKAKELIEAVKESGADCAKFQIVFAEEIIHKNIGNLDLPGGPTPLFDRFKALEEDVEFYRELKYCTESKGLFFLCSIFGKKSADMYRQLEPDLVKIASPEINHIPLLRQVRQYDLPVIVSTGMSDLSDMETAARIFPNNLAFLHCVTSYPAPIDEYNLQIIPPLRELFSVPIGVSDHSLDPLLVPSVSVHLGASFVEKHICLGRGTEGLDDAYALTPSDFKAMCTAIREIERLSVEKRLVRLKEQFGKETIERTMGSGRKKVTPSEEGHYLATRRSVRARERLKEGTVLTEENIGVLRSTMDFVPGISPAYYSVVLGKKVLKPVREGDGITWDALLSR